ncbi:hypothetical protein [Streptomyces sp. NPDC002082]|uniref:hypothetical protein n=1 Tax=Streptomyces sp. NPDC002082 TaxID=3154772 RepID=UPI0033213F1E
MTPAPGSAPTDRYTRYRTSLISGTGASQTLTQWLPLATLAATNDALPTPPRRTRARKLSASGA